MSRPGNLSRSETQEDFNSTRDIQFTKVPRFTVVLYPNTLQMRPLHCCSSLSSVESYVEARLCECSGFVQVASMWNHKGCDKEDFGERRESSELGVLVLCWCCGWSGGAGSFAASGSRCRGAEKGDWIAASLWLGADRDR